MCLLGPVRGYPNYFSRFGWSSRQSQDLSGSLFPQLMHNKCASDLSFDAVTTLGDATFFFREKSVDENTPNYLCTFFFFIIYKYVYCFNLSNNVFPTRYLWIKHNEHHDIKEGPIGNFMPKIESGIDAAFWVPRRSTAYLIHRNSFE